MTPTPFQWTTDTVSAPLALSRWNDVVCEAIVECEIGSGSRDRFRAWLDKRPFGPIGLTIAGCADQEVRRTRRRISDSDRSSYYVIQMRRGTLRGRQYGREAFVAAGEYALFNSQDVFQLNFSDSSDCLVLELPLRWTQAWLACPEDVAAKTFARTNGWQEPLAATLDNLTRDGLDLMALPERVVADQIGAMLALAAGRGAVTADHGQKRQSLLEDLRQTLRNCFADPDLDPAALGQAHGVSKRTVHSVFAWAGTSFGRELLAVRLERARALLEDRRYDRLPVAEIGWRCGFVEPSHFHRRFSAGFGRPPGAYRRARQG